MEAIETLIWLTEAPAAERVGIDIPGDGGAFLRLCCKMATGSGKTIVMAMVIAWHILNKVAYPQDARFSKNVLVVAPGLTVKPAGGAGTRRPRATTTRSSTSCPRTCWTNCVRARCWCATGTPWPGTARSSSKRRRSVDKRGAESDEAYTREVLGEMANARNLLVINDEAHHAWRVNVEAEGKYLRSRDLKDSAEEATVWIGGLDRLHRARGILTCYDFSATPFTPSGKKSTEEALFGWIVSDFGLNDAIESGLVKTPRVVVRDDAVPDAKTYKSRLYHIYNDPDVKDDLNRKAEPEEPLPDLVLNAYYLLGYDWREAQRAWAEAGQPTPPVMITVCNRTETAARVKYAFDHRKIHIDELCDPERILHIDSKVLDEAEAQEEPVGDAEDEGRRADEDEDAAPVHKLTKAEQAELLRRTVDTVGEGPAGRADSERHLGGHAERRLGRQDRHAHHGPARLHQPVAVRAGGGPRPAADILRGEPGDRPVRAGIRQHLRRAVHLPAPRRRARRPAAAATPKTPSSRTRQGGSSRSAGPTWCASTTSSARP